LLVGGALLPGAVVNDAPQLVAGLVAGRALTPSANPLNDGGAPPPVRSFSRDQASLHHVNAVAAVALNVLVFPRTKAPLLGKEKTITDALPEEPR
jgi:hypothetical protein